MSDEHLPRAEAGAGNMSTVNIYSKGWQWLGRVLSNFAHTPFRLHDELIASIEGFHQGTKYEDVATQREIFGLCGKTAKAAGTVANQAAKAASKMANGCSSPDRFWLGGRMPLKSAEFSTLYRAALRAKFTTHPLAKGALLATIGCDFEHRVPRRRRGGGPKLEEGLTHLTFETLKAVRHELNADSHDWLREVADCVSPTACQREGTNGDNQQQLVFTVAREGQPPVKGTINHDRDAALAARCECAGGPLDLAKTCCPHIIAALINHDGLVADFVAAINARDQTGENL